MKVSDFLSKLRLRIRDEFKAEYTDIELIDYLNDAYAYWESARVASEDPAKLRCLSVASSVPVPSDFGRFAGAYPLNITDNLIVNEGDDIVVAKYYAFSPLFDSINDDINLPSPELIVLLQLSTVYALNRNQFDVSTDTSLAKALQDIVAQAKAKYEQ